MLYITKASGEQEPFSSKKFAKSLKKAGATTVIINKLIEDIKQAPELQTTRDIYSYAYNYLRTINRAVAARYSLKNALYELGPEGFYFERLILEILKAQGYAVQIDQIIAGFCVTHEIDVVALDQNSHFMVECKFHNTAGIKVNVKIPLYIKARFDDVKAMWIQQPSHGFLFHQAWLVTNTKFTSEAIKYGNCMNINLLGWSYPENNNVAQLIDKLGLHPVTCLTTLTMQQKKLLLQQGILLCRDLENNQATLLQIGLPKQYLQLVIKECKAIIDFEKKRDKGSQV